MPNDTTIDWTELTRALAEPFDESQIKYRAGAISRDKTKALALAYADCRTYEDRLNALLPGAWDVHFEAWGDNRIICRLSIHGVVRSSTGEASDSPNDVKGTAAEAQSFRRACSKFGLGRFLYAREPRWMPYDAARKQLVLEDTPSKAERATPQTRSPKGIGPERAAGMHRALRDVRLPPKEHKAFASKVLCRPVTALDDLSEEEARKVWAAAQQARRTPDGPSGAAA